MDAVCCWCGRGYSAERIRRDGNYCGAKCRTGASRERQKMRRAFVEYERARKRLELHRGR